MDQSHDWRHPSGSQDQRVVGIFSPGQEGTLGHLMLSSQTSKETLQGLVLVGEARVAGEL